MSNVVHTGQALANHRPGCARGPPKSRDVHEETAGWRPTARCGQSSRGPVRCHSTCSNHWLVCSLPSAGSCLGRGWAVMGNPPTPHLPRHHSVYCSAILGPPACFEQTALPPRKPSLKNSKCVSLLWPLKAPTSF